MRLTTRRPGAPMTERLRVATFNLESLGDASDGTPPLETRVAALRPVLERLEADMLCLQEVNGQKPDKHAPRTLDALDALAPAPTESRAGPLSATARQRFWPPGTSSYTRVFSVTFAVEPESLSRATFTLTFAACGVTSGVVTYVPQCATWTGAVFTNQRFR